MLYSRVVYCMKNTSYARRFGSLFSFHLIINGYQVTTDLCYLCYTMATLEPGNFYTVTVQGAGLAQSVLVTTLWAARLRNRGWIFGGCPRDLFLLQNVRNSCGAQRTPCSVGTEALSRE
jgi:hypothetical protein